MGSVAIQLAKHLGLRVATTVSSAKVAFVESLGADRVIDRKKQRFEQELRGMDAVLDSVFPFDQTPQAIARAEQGKAHGKVVIEVRTG